MTDKIPATSDNKEAKSRPVSSVLLNIGKVLLIVLGVIAGIIVLALVALFITCSMISR